jgi:hypothetical protein
MLSAEDLGVKVAVSLSWSSLCVCLSSDFDALVVKERYVFWNKGVIKWVEVKSRIWKLLVVGREGGRGRHRWRGRPRMLEACKDGRKQTTVNKEPQTRASRSTHAGAFSLVSR